MERMPSFLRSTVVTHRCSSSTQGLVSVWPTGTVITLDDIISFPSVLVQGFHVTHHGIQVRIAQLHGGHQRPRFDCAGVLDPKTETVVSVFSGARRNRGAAHQMGQIRAKASIRRRSVHSMTVHAGVPFKHLPASDCASVFDCGLLLSLHPAGKILRSVYRNAEQHLSVLGSAIWRTLAKKDSGALRLHPHSVGVVWNKIRLAGKLRHPKTVVGIG